MFDRRFIVSLPTGLVTLLIPNAWNRSLAGEENMLRAHVERDLTVWNAIENHRTATKGDRETAAWLVDEINATGQMAEVETFPFVRRDLGTCVVEVGDQTVPGVPLFDGGLTGPDGMKGTLVPLGEEGDIAVTRYGPFWNHPLTQKLEKARKENRYNAIVAIADGQMVRPGLALLNADAYMSAYGPPVLQISTEHGDKLEKAAADRSTVRVIAHAHMKKTTAENVGVRIEGRNSDLKPLVVMTPRSAWWTCTSERGGGICAWLAAIRAFSTAQPDRTVMFTANTGHELGHVGLDHFIAERPRLVSEAHAWLHLGANLGARFAVPEGTEFLAQASSERLLNLCLAEMVREGFSNPQITQVGQRPLGEARNIHDGNGTYASFLGGGNALFHHPDDVLPDSVDMEKMVRLVNGILSVARALASESF